MSHPATHPQWILPEWPAPARVRAVITTRAGGVSAGRFDDGRGGGGMNIGLTSGDDVECVQRNRARLRAVLPAEPCWLRQVHGAAVADLDDENAPAAADAAITLQPRRVCAVSVADCMPVLFTDPAGRVVGVAHAGWRGLAAGILQESATAMRRRLGDADGELLAYLGPAIGPAHFEVGTEVLEAMGARLPHAAEAFRPLGQGKYLCDLFGLARQALAQVAIARVFGGSACTYSDPTSYYSYRRDKVTGRHAALIWIDA